MQIRNTKLVEKVKLGFIITLGIFLMFFVTVAKAQDFRYEVGLETSKDWSNVVTYYYIQ